MVLFNSLYAQLPAAAGPATHNVASAQNARRRIDITLLLYLVGLLQIATDTRAHSAFSRLRSLAVVDRLRRGDCGRADRIETRVVRVVGRAQRAVGERAVDGVRAGDVSRRRARGRDRRGRAFRRPRREFAVELADLDQAGIVG